MVAYYQIFGAISVAALASNLLFLVAILSLLQATLTLPGIAAIALTLGMAIDANVLINERIREELRSGMPPRRPFPGYERAFGTILDSNVTPHRRPGAAHLRLRPVRGFAVVHCPGHLTSIFSSVVVSAPWSIWSIGPPEEAGQVHRPGMVRRPHGEGRVRVRHTNDRSQSPRFAGVAGGHEPAKAVYP